MRSSFVLVVLLSASLSCSGSGANPHRTPLLDPGALTPLEAAADPLADHRPPDATCPSAAWGSEGGALEVQTGACRYAAFEQLLAVRPASGDELHILMWHDELDAPTPARGHAAVLLGDRIAWEAEFDIPSASASMDVVVPITEAPPEGARLGLHLHNHGYNSWRFYAVDLLRQAR